jgi:hypothetical protein
MQKTFHKNLHVWGKKLFHSFGSVLKHFSSCSNFAIARIRDDPKKIRGTTPWQGDQMGL